MSIVYQVYVTVRGLGLIHFYPFGEPYSNSLAAEAAVKRYREKFKPLGYDYVFKPLEVEE